MKGTSTSSIWIQPGSNDLGGPTFDNSLANTNNRHLNMKALDEEVRVAYSLSKRVKAVKNCRRIRKRDMMLNDATPHIVVDPETHQVTADGKLLVTAPAQVLSLAQRYFLF
jgi:urease subunit alpha